MNHQDRFCDLCPFFYCLLLPKRIWSYHLYNCHSSSFRHLLDHLYINEAQLPQPLLISHMLKASDSSDSLLELYQVFHICLEKEDPILGAADQMWTQQRQLPGNHNFPQYGSHISSNIAQYIRAILLFPMEVHCWFISSVVLNLHNPQMPFRKVITQPIASYLIPQNYYTPAAELGTAVW